ncbi:Glycosyltransferase involved in cell wall bisynthesis [Thiohalospira halophila DSM 15071]|uniref:Glycosyltransferase involved in cell wall bisynthesis n=1 Tax=Thiohalospira halophila DSM 15071 TaxID=1123397 RepID=A0A1I1RAV3_9GAMM|nr:glycosyltransferase family 1 protein [Thiohalospira halophila]SFD31516.1 Glycosyltransferase involved in cell wall bisynthesis [Thiohalospira halophila DSM 15071]
MTEVAHSLRVELITETWAPEINGVARTLETLVNGLRARGHRVGVVRPRHQGGTDSHGPAELLVPGMGLPGYPGVRLGLPAGRELRRRWAEARPDVIYIATEGPLGHSALRQARRLGIPVVAGFHTNFDAYSGHYHMGLLRRPVEAYLRRFHNRATTTLVPSAEGRERLIQRGFQRLALLGRGVDTELFDPRRRSQALRAEWGAGPETPVALHVGRIAPEKNIEGLISAFRAIRQRVPECALVVVGNGPATERLATALPELILTGPRTGGDLARHYASGDLFVFPSRTETFGNVVTEAMASGLAVVAFNRAAAGRYLRDGVNGRLVEPEDDTGFNTAAAELAADPGARARMGQAARETAQGIGWEAVIEEFEVRLGAAINSSDGRAA